MTAANFELMEALDHGARVPLPETAFETWPRLRKDEPHATDDWYGAICFLRRKRGPRNLPDDAQSVLFLYRHLAA